MRIYIFFCLSIIAVSSSTAFADDPADPKAGVVLSKDQQGVKVETDCTKDPQNEKCTQTTKATVGPGGIGLQVENKTVEAVKEPPSNSFNFGATFGMTTGAGKAGSASSGVSLLLINLEVELNALIGIGQKFPGAEGGSWNGLLLSPSYGAYFGSMTFTGGYGEMAGTRAGAVIGYEYLNFGTMDPKTLEQKGWGAQAGIYVGTQSMTSTTHILVGANSITSTSTTQNSSVGPSLGFVFPHYNAGTAHLTTQEIRFMVLPTGDFTLIMLTGSWVF